MTIKEQKIEIGKCICHQYGNCKLDRMECPYSDCFADAVATEVIETGYRKRVRKIVWHKVADGDYPNEDKYVLCFTHYGEMCIWKLRRVGGVPYWVDTEDHYHGLYVIAWTELPEYKE